MMRTLFTVITLLTIISHSLMAQEVRKKGLFKGGRTEQVSNIEESGDYIIISGKVQDASTGEPLVGVIVKVKGTTIGAITGVDGSFQLKLPKNINAKELELSYIGYSPKTISIEELKKGKPILLEPEGVALNEVKILASSVEEIKAPLSVTRVKLKEIQEVRGAQSFPELMKYTPSVYTSREGGGWGDSRISVRGFEQENVAVLINGIPVNDMENSRVYWSNWIGLSDVTYEIQIQRGVGNSRLSINSVGGTINIITMPSKKTRGGGFSAEVSNFYNTRIRFFYNTGLSKKGWAFSFLGSRAKGPGYVKGTDFEAWTYFIAGSKDINASHRITLTATGAPQWHYQRFTMLDKKTIEKYRDPWFNYDYGYLDGQLYGVYRNFYHKPLVILNHYWSLSEKTTLSTSIYGSWGRGGGSNILSKRGYSIPRRPDGLVDWEQIRRDNRDSTTLDTIIVGNDTVIGFTGKLIHRESMNLHNWYGMISNFQTKLFQDKLTLNTGIDLRYYVGNHHRRIKDLLWADFWVDYSNVNAESPIKIIGDKIIYNYTSTVYWYGYYLQTQLNLEKITLFFVGSISNTGYQRTDSFAYKIGEEDYVSDVINFLGYTVKGGVTYSINNNHHVFLNGGYYTRAPFFRYVFFDRTSNAVASNAQNEKITTAEVGYKLFGRNVMFQILGYYTYWKDKVMTSRPITLPDGSFTLVHLPGLNAVHKGIEIEGAINITTKFQVKVNGNLGDWRWEKDVTGIVSDITGSPVDTINLYIAGLYVGNSPQTQIGMQIRYQPTTNFFIQIGGQYFDRLYADFNPTKRTDPNDRSQPWKLPAYFIMDFNAGYDFPINDNIKGKVFANINNLWDTRYIVTARDGANHDYETSYFFYGLGRIWNLGISLQF